MTVSFSHNMTGIRLVMDVEDGKLRELEKYQRYNRCIEAGVVSGLEGCRS